MHFFPGGKFGCGSGGVDEEELPGGQVAYFQSPVMAGAQEDHQGNIGTHI